MGRMGVLAAALAAAVALAGGCGTSGPAEPERYAFAPTRACLEELEGAEVSTDDLDFVATTAFGGAMRVRLATNFVVLAFGDDEAEGERIELAYRQFAGSTIPVDDVLQRTKNVVLVWNAPPSPEERDPVLGCLRGEE